MTQFGGSHSSRTLTIEKDWTPCIWSAAWAWVIIWIPTAIMAARIATTSYTYSGHTLTCVSGLITRRTINLDLYRVRSISAESSPLAGGRLIIQETDGSARRLPYVKHAADVAAELRESMERYREQSGMNAVNVIS